MSSAGAFARLPECLLDAPVSDRAVRLYALLDRYAGQNGEAWPRRSTLAERLRTSLRSVDRALDELVDAGALDVISGAGAGTANRYRINRHFPPPCATHDAPPTPPVTHPPATGGAPGTPPAPHPDVTDDAPPCATRDAQKESQQNENHRTESQVKIPSSSPRATTAILPGPQDDDAAGRIIDEVVRLMARSALDKRNRELTERGQAHKVIPLDEWWRVDAFIARDAESRRNVEKLAGAYLAEDPTLTPDELASMLAPELVPAPAADVDHEFVEAFQ